MDRTACNTIYGTAALPPKCYSTVQCPCQLKSLHLDLELALLNGQVFGHQGFVFSLSNHHVFYLSFQHFVPPLVLQRTTKYVAMCVQIHRGRQPVDKDTNIFENLPVILWIGGTCNRVSVLERIAKNCILPFCDFLSRVLYRHQQLLQRWVKYLADEFDANQELVVRSFPGK